LGESVKTSDFDNTIVSEVNLFRH